MALLRQTVKLCGADKRLVSSVCVWHLWSFWQGLQAAFQLPPLGNGRSHKPFLDDLAVAVLRSPVRFSIRSAEASGLLIFSSMVRHDVVADGGGSAMGRVG